MCQSTASLIYRIFVTFLFLLLLWPSPVSGQISTSELAVSGDEAAGNEVAEEIANKTYAQEQSDLQRTIFKGYDRKLRPVLNQSRPTTVLFHAYLMHFSVDQIQQTIFMNGHIYMTWTDEMAVWDPSSYNNVRTTMVKQWEVWQPELRIANSVSGVNQYFEISRRSHATLTSMSPNKTKVEIYPTFSMRIGCNFDFSDFPFDEQSCAARLYTSSVMSEVELAIYYQLEPSVMLGWGNQSTKRHVQDWELLAVQANLSFYKSQRKYSDERPTSAYEAQSTWTLILLGVRLRRNAPQYWLGLGLPCVASLLLLLLSFLVPRPEHSVGLVLANFFLQTVLLRDALRTLPPAAGDKPRIVIFAQLLLGTTLLCLILHVFSRQIAQKLAQVPAIRRTFLPVPPDGGEGAPKRAAVPPDDGGGQFPLLLRLPLVRVHFLVVIRICCLLALLLVAIPATLILLL